MDVVKNAICLSIDCKLLDIVLENAKINMDVRNMLKHFVLFVESHSSIFVLELIKQNIAPDCVVRNLWDLLVGITLFVTGNAKANTNEQQIHIPMSDLLTSVEDTLKNANAVDMMKSQIFSEFIIKTKIGKITKGKIS